MYSQDWSFLHCLINESEKYQLNLLTIFNFQIIYTVDTEKLLQTIVSMLHYKFRLWFKKGTPVQNL